MSEVIIDKITGKTAAGDIEVTSEGGAATFQLQQGLAKVWIFLTVSASIQDSFNVSSVTDVGVAEYDPQITSSMSSGLYCCNTGLDLTGHLVRGSATEETASSSFKIICYQTQSTGATESGIDGLHNTSFGDLA